MLKVPSVKQCRSSSS